MGVKVYISGISGNKEVKKRQQRVCMILESRHIEYSVVDITEPGKEFERDYMQEKSTSLGATVGDANPRHPLPPQLFNDEEYCGDYDQFDLANEIDELDKFLKVASSDDTQVSNTDLILETNGTGDPEVESTQPEADSSEAEVASSEVVADSSDAVVDSTENNNPNEEEEEDEEKVASSEQDIVESSDLPVESSDLVEESDDEDA